MSLSEKSALVVGAGGLGGPLLLTLASAGVGRLIIVDSDVVENSNLARQPLFGESDIGAKKGEAAAARLRKLFPERVYLAKDLHVTRDNVLGLCAEVDLIADGSDNFETKFILSDAAIRAKKPLVHGAVVRTTFQLLTINPTGMGGCLRCLFENPPPKGLVPDSATAGVLGATASSAGALMAAEALRILGGERGAYEGRLLSYETRTARGRLVLVRRRYNCEGCSPHALSLPFETPPAGDAPLAPASQPGGLS